VPDETTCALLQVCPFGLPVTIATPLLMFAPWMGGAAEQA